jgi:hypothetical protein
MADPVITGLFRALVIRAGGVDVVAAVLEARWGVGQKSTVSRMCAGHIGVTLDAVVAVEDFLGARTVTDWMARRVQAGAGLDTIATLAADSMQAAGSAHAALTRAMDHRGDGGSDLTVAEAVDVVAQMTALRDMADRIIGQARAIVPQFQRGQA